MPAPKAEAYLRRLMQQYWSKKNFDTSAGGGGKGGTTNVYDPQSMLDAYWFTKDAQGNGSDVSSLPAGQNLGQLDDLNYFLKKLYNSLKIPSSRFIGDAQTFKDGVEITRDELRFARFIIRIQRQFATSIRDTFIAHLKLKGLWKQYKLKERSIHAEFNVPSTFMAMRDQQLLDIKFDNFLKVTGNQSVAPSYAQKYYLGLSDELMKENRDWLRKDAAFRWEISQIEQMGPNFREQQAAALGIEGGGATGGAVGGGGVPTGGELPPIGAEGEVPAFGGTAPVGAATPGVEAGGAPAGGPPITNAGTTGGGEAPA